VPRLRLQNLQIRRAPLRNSLLRQRVDTKRPLLLLRLVFTAKDGLDVAKSFLVRSKTGVIYSPDLGFSLEPGTHGDTFITTVEGFMYKVIDYAERLKLLEPEAAEKVDKFISTIYRKIEEGGFTLVVEDLLGKSFIVPHRQETVKIEYLD
jgi:zinc finger protein